MRYLQPPHAATCVPGEPSCWSDGSSGTATMIAAQIVLMRCVGCVGQSINQVVMDCQWEGTQNNHGFCEARMRVIFIELDKGVQNIGADAECGRMCGV